MNRDCRIRWDTEGLVENGVMVIVESMAMKEREAA